MHLWMYPECEQLHLHAHEMFESSAWENTLHFSPLHFSFISLNVSDLNLTSIVSNQHFMGIANPPCRAQIAQWLQAKHGLHQWKKGNWMCQSAGGGQKHPGESWKAELRSRQLVLITGSEYRGENGHA